jgi:hypothetical protein
MGRRPIADGEMQGGGGAVMVDFLAHLCRQREQLCLGVGAGPTGLQVGANARDVGRREVAVDIGLDEQAHFCATVGGHNASPSNASALRRVGALADGSFDTRLKRDDDAVDQVMVRRSIRTYCARHPWFAGRSAPRKAKQQGMFVIIVGKRLLESSFLI